MAYLIKRGINPERLTAKGYGESQLVNPCADAVQCSEAEHQQNRRSTFVIVAEE
jgi:outer membrane protein OmpA-like peptidoglycan-associated protein